MKRKINSAFTLVELLVVISIIAVLAGIALPVYSTVQERGAQTKDLSNAKQIGLALKLYASDTDGKFPDKDGQAADPPVTALTAASKANQAFACLIPAYISTENTFYVAKSKWNSASAPDEKTTASTDRLIAGENNFGYVLGLTETDNPNYPLVLDGPATGGQDAVYSTDPTVAGGVWKGKKAVVIRIDQSGAVEKCVAGATATTPIVKGQTGTGTLADIFVPTATWLTGATVLLPQ